ncbi:Exportin-2 [Micractinium conductrix]|uniref:Exportin-2 n=1 Tax=Micractinium conductrix TaxID=554055 RepID=A0A2P6VDT3_9CHLO|nr:Exportin-2 [Micractinium conductrix]|eukprot:PSC72253.1 Exportin-2 [Micractinium conductrix]
MLESVPVEVRQAAAVNFKNFVKYHWAPRESDGLGAAPMAIPDGEKDQVKAHITDLMLSTPPRVRAQLSEALSIISSHDFPARWPSLLPHLVEKMGSTDPQLVNGVLSTADSIYQRYRGQFMTDQLSEELDYSQAVVKPLLACLQAQSKRAAEVAPGAAAGGAAAEPLRLVLSNVHLACSIFYSLNSPGLTDAFEDTLDAWMAEFHTFLTLDAPALAEADPEKESVVDGVKAQVCECLILFMERNEEEFAKFLQAFSQDVWTQLMKVSQAPGQDNLAMHAINFLTAVARSVHYTLFEGADTLRQICESIVIPNLRMREDMEEMFEMNWVEYVRRDTEGSDSDTRRRAASELVKALTDRFPQQVTELFSGYVGAMLAEHAHAPAANWKAKDCALYLVTALTVRGKTAAAGATTTNTLVNLQDFFVQQVAPELQAANPNEQPVLKADALKFVTTFRSQLPKEAELGLFPSLINLLGCEANVVHSYAAIAIDRLLSMREPGSASGQRFQPAELAPLLQPLLEKLFGAFKFPESGENEYLMQAVMRVIAFVGKQIAPVAPACLQQLSALLLAVCQNPQQPGFNHYLFESVAALVRYGCEVDPSGGAAATYEQQLFPPFQVVLSEDVQEFHPYVFQIFAQLLESRPAGAPVPDAYHAIFPPLLTPAFWERSGNVPALVRLLQAYISRAAPEVATRGYLQPVLGVFQKLIASKAHDHEGFNLLSALVSHLDYQAQMAQYMPTIWGLLFSRLQSSRTPKFTRSLLLFMALFVCKRGAATVAASIDGVQPGLTLILLQSVWLPTLPSVTGAHEEKLLSAATAAMLADAPQLAAPESAELAGRLLAALVTYLDGGAASGGEEGGEEGGAGEEEFAGYSAAYARLHNAHKPEVDPLPDVKSGQAALAQALGKLSAAQPGRVPQLVGAALSPELQQTLAGYCAAAGVSIA